MKPITDFIAKLLHSKAAPIVQALTGFIVSYLVHVLPEYLKLSDSELATLQLSIAATLTWLIGAAVQWYDQYQTLKVQKAVGVTQDAWIGDKTVNAVEDYANSI